MPTTLSTFSIPTSEAMPDTDRVDSIDFRSATIGKLAARLNAIPSEVTRQLLLPHTSSMQVPQADPLAALMEELLSASGANEPLASYSTKDHNQTFGASLSVSLQWLYQLELCFGEPLTSRIVLKALMPLYLAAGHGRASNGMVDTFSLIRMSCMIAELNRLTSENDLAAWSKESSRSNVDLFESIPKSFRIALPKMANSFWVEIAFKSNLIANHSTKLPDATSLAMEKHRAWWSLAGQLCNQSAQITIPADLSVGVIAWEKLLDHWQRVSGILSGQALCSAGTNSDTLKTSACKKSTVAIEGEELVKKDKPSEPTESEKYKIANDHRFVEIRSARDPQLCSNLEQLLQQCRVDSGMLSLMVVKKLGTHQAVASASLQNWQTTFIEYMDSHGEATNVRGFVSDEGELSLVFHDVERSELAQWIRESFSKFNNANADSMLATSVAVPLVAGVAMVNAPSRSFKIDQLIQSAWRCLEGATTQGAGAVKTIEVY